MESGRGSRPGSMRGSADGGVATPRSADGEGARTARSSRRDSNVYKEILGQMEDGARGELPTLHEQIEAAGWGRFQFRALVAFVLFVVSEAMEVTVPNVVWDRVRGDGAFGPTVDGPGSASFRAVVASAPLLGNILGSVLGGVVADAYGRHAALYLHSALFVAASLASALSGDKTSFVAARAALGVSLGLAVPVLVSFMAELAPVAKRARAVLVIPGFGFPCGQILMLMVGLLLQRSMAREPGQGDAPRAAGFEWWRWLMVAGIVPNVAALVLLRLYVPESPHFLLSVGETDKAERVLRTMARVNNTEALLLHGGRVRPLRAAPSGDAGASGGELSADGRESKAARIRRQGAELLSPPLHARMLRLLGMWMLVGIGQFGADIILPKMLEAHHLDMAQRMRTLLMITILAWPAFFVAIHLLERWPQMSSRRSVMVGMAALSSVAAMLAGVLVSQGLLMLIATCVLVKMSAHGCMQTMDLYSAETLPSTHRATGIALANGASKLVGVLAAFYSLSSSSFSGGRLETTQHYFAFAAAFAAAAVVAWLGPDVGGDGRLLADYQELVLNEESKGEEASSECDDNASGGGSSRNYGAIQ